MHEHAKEPSKRHAQHALARDVVEMIHGEDEAKTAEANHRMLFAARSGQEKPAPIGGDLSNSLNEKAPQTNSSNMPTVSMVLPHSLVYHRPIARILHSAGLVSSKSEGHRLAANQGAYIGSRADGTGRMREDLTFTPVTLFAPYRTKDYIIDGDLLILRVGKWKLKVVKIVSDEEFERRGLTAPGWEEMKKEAEEAKTEAEEPKKEAEEPKKEVEEGATGEQQPKRGSFHEDRFPPKKEAKEVKKEAEGWGMGKQQPRRESFHEDRIQPKKEAIKEYRMSGRHVRG